MRFILINIGNIIGSVFFLFLGITSFIAFDGVGVFFGILLLGLSGYRAYLIYANYEQLKLSKQSEVIPDIKNYQVHNFFGIEVHYPGNWASEVDSGDLGDVLIMESPLFAIAILNKQKEPIPFDDFMYSFKLRTDANTPGLEKNSFETKSTSMYGYKGVQERFIVVDNYGRVIMKRIFLSIDEDELFLTFQAPESDFETIEVALEKITNSIKTGLSSS